MSGVYFGRHIALSSTVFLLSTDIAFYFEVAGNGSAINPPIYGRTDSINVNQPQLRISLDLFAGEGDGRFAGSEGVGDEAG